MLCQNTSYNVNREITNLWNAKLTNNIFYMHHPTDRIATAGLRTGWKEGNVLFNDTLNTFYLWLYCVRHMVKDHTVSKRGNPPHGLLFPISSKGSFI